MRARIDRKMALHSFAGSLLVAGMLTCSTAAVAATCPATLADAAQGIVTADFQSLVTEALDERVAKEGGLEAAIAHTHAHIERLTWFKAGLTEAADAETRLAVDEELAIMRMRLAALECRRGVTAP